MLVRSLPILLLLAGAPTFAQDVPATAKAGQKQVADEVVQPCDAAKPGGKVSMQDMSPPRVSTEKVVNPPASGGGTGKVSIQDLHRSAAPTGSDKAILLDSSRCAAPKP